jgi:hypothetical protein
LQGIFVGAQDPVAFGIQEVAAGGEREKKEDRENERYLLYLLCLLHWIHCI